MGPGWDIECVDCKDILGLSDIPRTRDLMNVLIRYSSALAALAPLFEESHGFTIRCFDDTPLDLTFFHTHKGHQLRPVNDLGERGDRRCGASFECPFCHTIAICIRWDHPRNLPHRHIAEPSRQIHHSVDHSADHSADHSVDHHSADHHSADHHSADHHSADHHSADHHSADHHSADHHSADHHSADHHLAEV